MKNKIFITLFSLLLSASLFAQEPYYSGSASSSQTTPADNAKDIIQQIIDVVGLKPNFEVMAARVDNAAAVIYGGKRYILYNPSFFTSLIQSTGTKWAAVSVLAHEIGHHLDGHTLAQIGSEPQSELEADEFSGFVLRKMGASLDEAQVAMKTAASQRASSTHPGQYDRLHHHKRRTSRRQVECTKRLISLWLRKRIRASVMRLLFMWAGNKSYTLNLSH